MNELHSNIKAALLFIKGRSALGISGSTVVDLQGYNGAEIVLGFKGSGATYVAASALKFTVLHGNTSTAATGAIGTNDLIGNGHTSGVIMNINSEAAATAAVAAGCERWGYIGGKRYLRVRYSASGVATSATGANTVQFTGMVIKGLPAVAPVANEA
jgi:hypothetical protein